MKKYFGKLCLGGVFLFSLSMSLTSCEDILGEWSRPTPNPVTPGGGGSSTIAVTGVKLNEAYLRFDKNVLTAQTLTATVSPADATDKTVTWESSDESVATVDENGQVTPKTKGTVTITATAHDGSGIKATSTVIVYDKIHNINTDGNASVSAGEWLIEGNGTAVAKSITIGDGAKVTLNGINVTQQIVCSATATIILADGSTNTVDATGINNQAAIQIGGTGKTLTIDAETEGTGTLTAKGGSKAAGIGTNCAEEVVLSGGNIVINGGTVTATGGDYGAGIGTGRASCNVGAATITCGDITINGGTVTAQGGKGAAGIGTGQSYKDGLTASNECGAIKIGTGVISVTAKKSSSNPGPNSIGKGEAVNGSTQACGTVTIGGVVGEITTSPYTYTPAP